MVHGIEFSEGRARSYRNRWIRTKSLQDATGLEAAPPARNGVDGFGGVHVMSQAGRILALGEVGSPYELDREVETLRQYDFDARLVGNMTAHPKIDGVTGELVFFGYEFTSPLVRYHRADADGNLVQSEAIDLPQVTMMHDFAATANRVVFMDLPVILDMALIGSAEATMPFRWDADTAARLGIMQRTSDGSDLAWIDIDPCYVFHTLNAYDAGDRIVMDVARYPRMFTDPTKSGPNETEMASLHRWIIDVTNRVVKQEQLDDTEIEFPRVDERIWCHPHRYGYTVRMAPATAAFDTNGIVKYDLEAGRTGTSAVREYEASRFPSEPVFVPDAPDSQEDEGWLLTVVYDATTDRSDVEILDARDLSIMGTVHLPVRVPFGFHGSWIPRG